MTLLTLTAGGALIRDGALPSGCLRLLGTGLNRLFNVGVLLLLAFAALEIAKVAAFRDHLLPFLRRHGLRALICRQSRSIGVVAPLRFDEGLSCCLEAQLLNNPANVNF